MRIWCPFGDGYAKSCLSGCGFYDKINKQCSMVTIARNLEEQNCIKKSIYDKSLEITEKYFLKEEKSFDEIMSTSLL